MTFFNRLKGYKLVISDAAKKDIEKIDNKFVKAIHNKLDMLINGHQGLDVKKLEAYKEPTYRLRVNDYRVIYLVLEHIVIVKVIQVDHRKDVYE